MFNKYDDYDLRVEGSEHPHYFVSFKDGQGTTQKFEVDEQLFMTFISFSKVDRKQKNVFQRYIEHSEITEATLNQRATTSQRSVDQQVADNEYAKELYAVIKNLSDKQRRRFLLYYGHGITLEEIARLEGCSRQPVERSIRAAEKKIIKKLKNFSI